MCSICVLHVCSISIPHLLYTKGVCCTCPPYVPHACYICSMSLESATYVPHNCCISATYLQISAPYMCSRCAPYLLNICSIAKECASYVLHTYSIHAPHMLCMLHVSGGPPLVLHISLIIIVVSPTPNVYPALGLPPRAISAGECRPYGYIGSEMSVHTSKVSSVCELSVIWCEKEMRRKRFQ